MIFDCFVEQILEPNAPDDIHFVFDNDDSWARYLILFAGYSNPFTVPGALSNRLMSLLEELATSGKFYAREGLIRSRTLRQKLEEKVRFDDDLDLCWFGNDGKDFIQLSPLHMSMIP